MPKAAPSPDPFPLHVEKGDAFLPDLGLWLDPHRPRDFAFVSHAHADHFAPHGKTICSSATRHLIESRFGNREANFLSLDFGESYELETGDEVELYPAGHIPGSSMLCITSGKTGRKLLHTGDFKTRPALGAETIEIPQADLVIMETTFGIPRFRLPPAETVIASMTKYAREAIEDEEIPIFMAYSLGKAQEILLALHDSAPELRFQVHPSVAKMNQAVAELGYPLPECEVFSPKEKSAAGHVLVIPPNAGKSRAIRQLRKKARLAMISGWGMDPSARYRYQCDEVFPLSDHADYDDLLAFVDTASPRKVLTIHGYRDEFARDLRTRGVEAWPLSGATQLELALDPTTHSTGSSPTPNPVDSAEERPASEFSDFVQVCERIQATTGKKKKQEVLAEFLSGLPEKSLRIAVRLLAGTPFRGEKIRRSTQVGWALIRQALLDLTGLTLAQYRQVSNTQADVVRTTYLILQGHTQPIPHSLGEIQDFLETLAELPGQSDKTKRLREELATYHFSEAALLVGILTGDLRIGLKEGLLEESIAATFDSPLARIREAHMLTGDLGEVAQLARENRLEEASARWFTPLRVMLASPEETAEDIVARLGASSEPIWLEDKFDGIRAQLHRRGDEVEVYSRDLRPLGEEFPELFAAARELSADVILDGEIIAFEEGKKLTFFDLQKRLGKKKIASQGDLFLGDAIPIRFIAFDILAIDGQSLLNRPLRERRKALESVEMSVGIRRCEVFAAKTAAEVDDQFNAARRRENEGLIAKDPESVYSPGRRGKQWLKLKKAMPTLDVVVVKAQQGHGKRAHVLSDYTFALREESTGELLVLGKAYSGLTDEEIEELTTHFESRTLEKKRNVRTVEPDIVLEIAFDSIQPSKRHSSGLSLRFPRIKAIRRDKTPADIDTLSYARKLAGVDP